MSEDPSGNLDGAAREEATSILRQLHQAVDRVRDLARSGHDLAPVAEIWREAQVQLARLETVIAGRRSEELLDRLSFALEEVEQSAREFFRRHDGEAESVARRMTVLRGASRLLRRCARILEGRPPRDETPFMLQELREVERVLAGNAIIAEFEATDGEVGDDLDREVERVRFEVLERQARALLEAAATESSCVAERVGQICRLARGLRRITADLEDCADDGGEDLRLRLHQFAAEAAREHDRLQALFIAWIRGLESPDDLERAGAAVIWLTGELDEARASLVERAGPRRVRSLHFLRLDGLETQRVFRQARKRVEAKAPPEPVTEPAEGEEGGRLFSMRRIDAKLRRTTARLRNALADRLLTLRLERIFGKRIVRAWEIMIFWLIMAVIALIIVDHFSDPVPEGEFGWTSWADTLICAFLLTDFFVRLALSPERLRYFRRNFLTEFLPSLPFAVLTGHPVLREVRVVRIIRSLRILRPLLRLVRLFLFLARAADRLVERNSWILNQNIVFFSDPVRDRENPTLLNRARDLDNWIVRRGERRLLDLEATARREGCRWQLAFIEAELVSRGAAQLLAEPGRMTGHVRDLHVDDVIGRLRELDDNQVADFVGHDVARQITTSLSLFRLPLLRRLPLIRFLLGPTGAPDPLWTTARLGRMGGDFLAWLQRLLNWFADLYGTITGAQFLDRFGMSLMKATARPAKRLVIFSLVVFLFLALAHLSRIDPWIGVADGFTRFLKGPLLFLGLICFLPLGLGAWLRRIAGQAVDLFDRVAEAQFLALTEIVKEDHGDDDLSFLVDRVLLPEVAMTRAESRDLEAERDTLVLAVHRRHLDEDHPLPVSWSALETMMLYYRDFIDGAYFHRNDTKVANMLLGNLTLENIRRVRLRYDAKRFKQLDRLDIARGKGGVTGPKVWFDFITHSVSQHVARLIIEYNQHCIPADELDAAHAEDRRIFDLWLERRRRLSSARRHGTRISSEDLSDVSGSAGTLIYRTTEFNALHFLTVSAKRDHDVRERYGAEVAGLLEEDRENLVRDIFGTFPMHELPKERRTLNPYVQYRRYLARGRVFLFPIVGMWLLFKGLRLLIARVIAIVKDVLDPNERPIDISAGRAGFDVARRKIFRMRRPVVLEALRLRALFDVEYLGIATPLGLSPSPYAELLNEDLRYLEASEREWERFRDIKSERERQVRLLARLIEHMKGRGRDLVAELEARNPALASRRNEALRAAATAFVCDHAQMSSIATAMDDIGELVLKCIAEPPPAPRLTERLLRRRLGRLAETAWPLLARAVPGAEKTGPGALADLLVRLPEFEENLELLARVAAETDDASVRIFDALLDVALQPSSWSEQIIALRAVQSLGILDLKGYERLIAALGRYGHVEMGRPSERRRVGI